MMATSERSLSMTERIANNLFTIVVARVAMIVTPVLLTGIAWVGVQIWESLDERLSAVEAATVKQSSQLQDHELRLNFSDAQAQQFKDLVERRFNELGGAMKDLGSEIVGINGAIIRLQTTIENRLPPRTANVEKSEPMVVSP